MKNWKREEMLHKVVLDQRTGFFQGMMFLEICFPKEHFGLKEHPFSYLVYYVKSYNLTHQL